jgi:polyisoprenoid-binding protein YceI
MKIVIAVIVVVLVILGLLTFVSNSQNTSHEEAPEPTVAEIEEVVALEGDEYKAQDGSVITWIGKSAVLPKTHIGTIALKNSSIVVGDSGSVVGGEVVFDMTTLTGDVGDGLDAHLSSADFFDVENFSEARFEIASVEKLNEEQVTVAGNLTIKDVTNLLSFTATIEDGEEGLTFVAEEFELNRLEWGVRFGSNTIFDNLGDAAISDTFSMSFDLALEAVEEEVTEEVVEEEEE